MGSSMESSMGSYTESYNGRNYNPAQQISSASTKYWVYE